MQTQSTRIPFNCVVCGTKSRRRVNRPWTRFCSKSCASIGVVRPLAERFWPKVDKNGPIPEHVPELGPCWIWIGARVKDGYGVIGTGGKHSEVDRAHKISYTMTFGPIPDGLWVLHRCDNPSCVRPDHLFAGTPLDNIQDMVRKGRASHQKKAASKTD